MLHLMIINYDYNAAYTSASEWFDHAEHVTSWAAQVQAAGAQVTVFQRFFQDDVIKHNKIVYHLVGDRFAAQLHAWQIPRQLHWSARVLCAAHVQVEHTTLVQVNGLCFPLQIRYLRSLLPSACPVVVQHQGEQPWSAPYRPIQRWGLQGVDGFFFSNPGLAQAWVRQKIISSPQKIYSIAADSFMQVTANLDGQAPEIYADIIRKHTESIS